MSECIAAMYWMSNMPGPWRAWLCAGAGQPEVWKHGPVLASGRPRWKRLFLDLWAAGPLYAQNPRFLFSRGSASGVLLAGEPERHLVRVHLRGEFSPCRRLVSGCVKSFIGGREPYRALIHRRVPIVSIGIEITPATIRTTSAASFRRSFKACWNPFNLWTRPTTSRRWSAC